MYRNFVRNSTSWYKIYVGFYVKCEFTTLATEIRNQNSTSWYKIYVGFYVKFEFTRLALGRFAEIVIRD